LYIFQRLCNAIFGSNIRIGPFSLDSVKQPP
jgi:hypothetical protein